MIRWFSIFSPHRRLRKFQMGMSCQWLEQMFDLYPWWIRMLPGSGWPSPVFSKCLETKLFFVETWKSITSLNEKPNQTILNISNGFFVLKYNPVTALPDNFASKQNKNFAFWPDLFVDINKSEKLSNAEYFDTEKRKWNSSDVVQKPKTDKWILNFESKIVFRKWNWNQKDKSRLVECTESHWNFVLKTKAKKWSLNVEFW
jgi:hypothetical protein